MVCPRRSGLVGIAINRNHTLRTLAVWGLGLTAFTAVSPGSSLGWGADPVSLERCDWKKRKKKNHIL